MESIRVNLMFCTQLVCKTYSIFDLYHRFINLPLSFIPMISHVKVKLTGCCCDSRESEWPNAHQQKEEERGRLDEKMKLQYIYLFVTIRFMPPKVLLFTRYCTK